MRTFAPSALIISLAGTLLVSCGALPLSLRQAQSDTWVGTPGTMPQAAAPAARAGSRNFKVIYSFGAPPDGNKPEASLIDVGGTLYGTTAGGGSYSCVSSSNPDGCGTVFTITPSGVEKVLYRFGAPPDGDTPTASLLDVSGTLYGTTSFGGSYTCGYPNYFSCGTVFSITTSGTETVLHSFGGRDGVQPDASLIEVKGTLYGTTAGGGANYCSTYYFIFCGTVFSITPGGDETVVHSFGYGRHPYFPHGSLIDAGGALYGTTNGGGVHEKGTVFRITPSGKMKVLHSFGKGNDGKYPVADVIEADGTFYGTTPGGGAYSCGSRGFGCGTVFSITQSGTEKVLHSFGSGTDGSNPKSGLIALHGKLYGTTPNGGGSGCGGYGCGTVFSITTSGTEKVLHDFGGADGSLPAAGLVDVKGTLYGTTEHGGAAGNGTVFALTP